MTSILVVDDEQTLVLTLTYNLEKENFEVFTASDGESALEIARVKRPDLLILDLMLPGMSGLDVCRVLRTEADIPILMLTAKGTEVDKVVGLEIGADDYLTKPFGMRELLARVRALLRRSSERRLEEKVLTAGDLTLDQARHEVFLREERVHLKPKEYDLLRYFMTRPGRVFTRDHLLNEIWGYEFIGDSRTVDVHVRWLREKIEPRPGTPVRIITVRGTGYRFET